MHSLHGSSGQHRLGECWATPTPREWNAHDALARELLARYGGLEVDHSDGFFLLFERPVAAARYAVAYHQALDGLDLRARIGLHVGNVALRANLDEAVARGAKRFEVDGAAKPLAARVMALAQPRQTLITDAAWEAIAGQLPDVSTHACGFYRLKGISEPVRVAELVSQGSAVIGPPPDVDKAYRVVRDGELWRPGREIRHNLPAHRDAFVGRSAELQELSARVEDGARLITVLGAGGMGKTRLAIRYATAWLGEWPGGVYFCDLSEARSLDGVLFAVARSLQVVLHGTDPTAQVGAAIAGRGRCLLIFDNFEQVSQLALLMLGPWLDVAPCRLHRHQPTSLGLQGEALLALESLSLSVGLSSLLVRAGRRRRTRSERANRSEVERVVRCSTKCRSHRVPPRECASVPRLRPKVVGTTRAIDRSFRQPHQPQASSARRSRSWICWSHSSTRHGRVSVSNALHDFRLR